MLNFLIVKEFLKFKYTCDSFNFCILILRTKLLRCRSKFKELYTHGGPRSKTFFKVVTYYLFFHIKCAFYIEKVKYVYLNGLWI